ncbi:MAG: PTS fructose transporter subunit IIA [Nitrosomonas sp.]|nr:PTS fructose transporter subunit IIA [Nitrosomonas sp.]MDP1951713.1 PTS fructose transporter subunit IIA [Nitrosomonas sp.]
MIGILIIAHEHLGDGFIHCASHVMGEIPKRLLHLGVYIQDDTNVVVSKAREMVRQLDDGDGVLILSDIYGATPCNIASQLIISGKVECLSGINLPMLVRALTYRDQPLAVVVEKALSGGKDGVIHIQLESGNAA